MHLELAVGVALPLLAPKRLRHIVKEEVAVAPVTLQVEAASIERLELQRWLGSGFGLGLELWG